MNRLLFHKVKEGKYLALFCDPLVTGGKSWSEQVGVTSVFVFPLDNSAKNIDY